MNMAMQNRTSREAVACVSGSAIVLDPSGIAYLPDEGLLLVADLHLEKGSSFARRQVFLPPYDSAATLSRLEKALQFYNPSGVIALGDSFHDAAGAARLPQSCVSLLGVLASGRDWIWISGNHDPLPPANLPGSAAEEIAVGALVLRHEPVALADIPQNGGQICGHLHPAARVSVRGGMLRRPCFAADDVNLVMPAFGAFTGGLNVLDRAYAGLFAEDGFTAWMLGRDSVIPVSSKKLRRD